MPLNQQNVKCSKARCLCESKVHSLLGIYANHLDLEIAISKWDIFLRNSSFRSINIHNKNPTNSIQPLEPSIYLLPIINIVEPMISHITWYNEFIPSLLWRNISGIMHLSAYRTTIEITVDNKLGSITFPVGLDKATSI